MKRLKLSRTAVADWAAVLMAVCAVVVTGVVVRQQLLGVPGRTVVDTMVDDWQDYVAGGDRIGPDDAAATVVVFGDYECPFCRRRSQQYVRSSLRQRAYLAHQLPNPVVLEDGTEIYKPKEW